jgi:hypothetical protein
MHRLTIVALLSAIAISASVAISASSAGASQCPAGTTAATDPGCTSAANTPSTNLPAVSIPPPVEDVSGNLAPISGQVLIRLPGSSKFVLLSSLTNVPFGTLIDARHGRVSITVDLGDGRVETGQFYGGEFILTQGANGTLIETLAGGSFLGCPAPPHHSGGLVMRASASKKKPNTVIRQLWGSAHGNYETKGRYGSASVNGTIWLTQDRCDGTYVRVTRDSVTVVAFAHPHHHHHIKQGHYILIYAPGYP